MPSRGDLSPILGDGPCLAPLRGFGMCERGSVITAAVRLVFAVLVVLGLGACSSHEEASSDTGSTSSAVGALPNYVVVGFQPERSDLQIETFVEDQLMVADPAGGRDFKFPYVGLPSTIRTRRWS